MDFAELESIEGLRWSWNSWPSSPSAVADLVIPLAVMYTPLSPLPDIPLLPYDPLHCVDCRAVINPYARVDYRSAVWVCPLCQRKNTFPRSYAGVGENSLPAELFPTYSTVDGFGSSQSSSGRSFSSSLSVSDNPGRSATAGLDGGPAFVFVVDTCSPEDELGAMKNEISHVLAQLPESSLVGLVSFGSMVAVHDLAFSDCSRAVILSGERDLPSDKVILLFESLFVTAGLVESLAIQSGRITTAIEEIASSSLALHGHRPQRATGAAISTSVALLEACLSHNGGRIMVFTSGPATVGPGMVVETDLSQAIRTHRDLINGQAPLFSKARSFYREVAERLSGRSIILDLFACSLDQVGAAEMRAPVESSGGFMVLAESFESEQFRRCLRHIFRREENDPLNMNFDATIEIITTKDIKISGALGPCTTLKRKHSSVSGEKIGESSTCSWKLCTLTSKTCIAFFFQVGSDDQLGPVFFIQFVTRYCHGLGGARLRVTTVARRWVSSQSPEIAAGFDQEAAAAVVARLAVQRAEECHARDVIRWLDDMLIRFTSRFGDYIPEDPSSFRLSSGFSLYPQFMYYLRRSQFIDIFNSSPDETAFFRLMLNRERVVESLIMIQPTLFQYSFDGPPIPVLLDISSVSPDVILLFDSYFYVVVHYGSKIAQWRKLGLDKEPGHESLGKLLEASESDAEALAAERVPVPKLIKCEQYGSQARFLLAKLNPSATQKTRAGDGSDIIFTDDVSLQVFMEHLQALAVQG
ncbi:unnamed protein product [Spirodela intermedia]|uniref:Protein transport protein SEC23 n=1 Tax=Spirodela intermedia TaxID=51605 RepID=A0A7I8IN57_SPIIN|nr:unnamed protein product [Spirodela intermedia]CAA6658994.1 unnamed protein product [Spirodela intermedia]